MKMLLSISLSILCITTTIAKSIPDSFDEQWEMYKIQFHKTYESEEEENTRKEIFINRVRGINRHNERFQKGEVSYEKGINQFTDFADDEILNMRTYSHPRDHEDENDVNAINAIPLEGEVELPPPEFDWREKNMVTRVKDQGNCNNGDWAFAAIGALESKLANKSKGLQELSEQELIDCSIKYGNYGCVGGSVGNAYRYINKSGISTEQWYPFTGKLGNCNVRNPQDKIATNLNIKSKPILKRDEGKMQRLVSKNGPIIAKIDASSPSFSEYKGGIFDEAGCTKNGSHHVLIVGYGEEGSKKFWIIKNSWGQTWGEKGYMKIPRNINACGIAENATYIQI